jgi:hypothetical protein
MAKYQSQPIKISSIIENHRLRFEEPKSTQTPGYNYYYKATNKEANKTMANKCIERVTIDIQVHILLPHAPSFGVTSSSLGHNLSPNSKSFSATTDNRQQTKKLVDNRQQIAYNK